MARSRHPDFVRSLCTFFLARGLTLDPLESDFDEIIEPIAMDTTEALALVACGQIRDLKTISAVYAVRSLSYG